MGEKLDKIIEGYKPIPMKRMMYPRGMKLSEDFVNAFHREFDRLVDEGANPKSLVERFGKALRFHQNEERRYHKIDEDKGNERTEAYNTGAQGNYVEVSTDKGVELMTPEEAEAYRKKKAAHKKQASDKKQAEK